MCNNNDFLTPSALHHLDCHMTWNQTLFHSENHEVDGCLVELD